jgi:hypothetical protein
MIQSRMVEISAAKSSSIQIAEQAGEMKLGRNAVEKLWPEKRDGFLLKYRVRSATFGSSSPSCLHCESWSKRCLIFEVPYTYLLAPEKLEDR